MAIGSSPYTGPNALQIALLSCALHHVLSSSSSLFFFLHCSFILCFFFFCLFLRDSSPLLFFFLFFLFVLYCSLFHPLSPLFIPFTGIDAFLPHHFLSFSFSSPFIVLHCFLLIPIFWSFICNQIFLYHHFWPPLLPSCSFVVLHFYLLFPHF